MPKTMLIDAAHPEETRVVVLDGNRVDDFDFETQNKKQLRGNIYLAKVTRVEPSLQAAFVEYGGNRHGFLAFGEIHPDYYSIPVADREALKAEFDAVAAEEGHEAGGENGEDGEEEDEGVIEERRRRILTRRYKIQEVIKRRQIMLVQVVKEERGNKGAALTTYLSLAGRYCVLMPNTGRGGGISRKITNAPDRKRLKKIATELEVPPGIGLIVRTAGAKRTKTEIKRDYEYLTRAWETIRDTTLRSVAPALIYEESSLVKRAIRDLYDKDVEDIMVEGDGAYKEAKDFIRMLMPSHAKKVHSYKEPTPIFTKFGVERQLETIFNPIVNLRSGGYIVINQTEALVAIDVNSGRSTRERNIEQTALRTNLEAAEEAARQMRLRDLAGLIVVDFIDMDEAKNDRLVEKRMKDSLRFDRARIQTGKISSFGLMEMSRQRRRTGILESSSHVCPTCSGAGRVRSVESSALRLLRALDDETQRRDAPAIEARAPTEVALYVLNEKRAALAAIEESRNVTIRVTASPTILAPDFEIVSSGQRDAEEQEPGAEEVRAERPTRQERQDRRPPRREEIVEAADEDEDDASVEEMEGAEILAGGDAESRRRRRRGRRGGKNRRDDETVGGEEAEARPLRAEQPARERAPRAEGDSERGRRKRRRRGRGRRVIEIDGGEALDMIATDPGSLFGPEPALEEAPVEIVAREAAPAAIEAPVAPPAPIAEIEVPAPSIFAAEPAVYATSEPAAIAPADPSPAAAAEQIPEPAAPSEPVVEEGYEPDLARREKFFSRLSRWGRKV